MWLFYGTVCRRWHHHIALYHTIGMVKCGEVWYVKCGEVWYGMIKRGGRWYGKVWWAMVSIVPHIKLSPLKPAGSTPCHSSSVHEGLLTNSVPHIETYRTIKYTSLLVSSSDCYLDLFLTLRRVWRPPESGCGIFDGPQFCENWLQLTFFDGLALPYALKLVCSQKESLKFITKCLKTPSKLKGDSPTASNLGNQSYGFVSK